MVALVVVTAACAVGQPVAAGTADPPVPEPPVDARAAARPPAPVEFESAGGLPRGDDRVSAQATTSTRLVAPTRSCVPELSGPESYQRAFDQRDGVWAGADGAVPVRLDGNRILWLFSDTIIGRVGWDGRRFPDWTLVHSSFVLQEGRCFTPLLRGRPGAWEDAIPRPQPNHYWWPVAGVFDPAQRKVHIFARRLEDYAPGEYRPPNAFKLVGFEIVHYALDGLRYLGREPLPSGFANRSGDVPYGAGVMPGRDGVYLYGCNTEIFVGDRGCYVARAARDLRPDSWRYWAPTGTGGGWSPNPADAMPMLLPDVPIGQLTVIPYGTGYLASGQDGLLVRAARAWYSDSPVGPWFPLGTAGDENASPHGPVPAHWRTYGGRILDLPGAGLVTAFNVNTGDDANFLLGWAYGARFAASLATGPGRGVEVSPTRGWYTLDGFGHVVPRGGAPHFGNPQFTGWDIARDLAVMPDGRGYVVLDGWGGLHRYGSARALPAVPARTYWPGWDIARAVAITPDGRGYVVLDGFGGLHAVGTARVPAGAPYWRGWDIARGLALAPDGRGLYVLDGFGGVHAVGAPRRGSPRFGWDIARGITTTARGYTVLDGLGGLHRFGDAPPPAAPSRAPAEYGAVTLRPDGRYVVQRRPGGADAVW